MKQLAQVIALIFVLLCVGFSASGQDVPDTIFVELDTATISTPDTTYLDTFFLIGVGTKNARNNKLNIRYLDAQFDTVGVAAYSFRSIKENEDRQGEADRRKMQADALTALYVDVNTILQNFTGGGYLANAKSRYGARYEGYYRATLGASTSYFRLNADGTSEEVDAAGVVVGAGYSGTWSAITQDRFRLVDHFPLGVVPTGTTFTRTTGDNFGSPGLAIRFEKIK